MSRARAAWKALTSRNVIVVAPGFQFSTYDNAVCFQTPGYQRIEVGIPPNGSTRT